MRLFESGPGAEGSIALDFKSELYQKVSGRNRSDLLPDDLWNYEWLVILSLVRAMAALYFNRVL